MDVDRGRQPSRRADACAGPSLLPCRATAPAAALADRLPPQALFILGALSQYVGAALAVLLFAVVPAAGVAWLRVVAAAAVLVAWRRPWQTPLDARRGCG